MLSRDRGQARIRGRHAARVALESLWLGLMLGGLSSNMHDFLEGSGVWTLQVVAVVLLTGTYATFRALHYQSLAEARVRDGMGGCLSCLSPEVRVEAGRLRCAACGYVGDADRGGGPLTSEEEESVDPEEVADEIAAVIGDP